MGCSLQRLTGFPTICGGPTIPSTPHQHHTHLQTGAWVHKTPSHLLLTDALQGGHPCGLGCTEAPRTRPDRRGAARAGAG